MGSNVTVMDKGGVFDMLAAIDRGDFVLDFEAAVKSVVESVVQEQRKGSVSIGLDIDYDSELGAVKVSAQLKTKLPKRPVKASLFFVTPEGNLTRYDSRQRDMFPETVGGHGGL